MASYKLTDGTSTVPEIWSKTYPSFLKGYCSMYVGQNNDVGGNTIPLKGVIIKEVTPSSHVIYDDYRNSDIVLGNNAHSNVWIRVPDSWCQGIGNRRLSQLYKITPY